MPRGAERPRDAASSYMGHESRFESDSFLFDYLSQYSQSIVISVINFPDLRNGKARC